ncbi:class I SAM-dependent methyltransferase [Kribbella capetownensis]|uniref:Class I SAM-dependent methyltransferase n=1 Tax=Kribbella capetownensis TaxID=1572659 RepID=A0A4R0JGG2_9ACTN|nr:class I SAM-dependent methyltransferase [Kribbella capetownensis]TCC45579.1 class I SAM-dependent methyltransferase [Kribbella capetownensis]
MTLDPYGDEELVELYDVDNPAGDDHDYFREVADTLGATKVIDLGCGTGLLTRSLVKPGRVVIGIDPSPTMLNFARRQPGADAVTWIDGDASAIAATGDVELVVSSGNTMMHVSDDDLPSALKSCAGALRSGGVITFESRNPAVRAWESWTRQATYGERDTPAGHLREWVEVTEVDGGRVVFDAHNLFDDGHDAVYTTTVYFRTAEEITAALEAAGFGAVTIQGGWHNEPATRDSRLLIFHATKQ